MIQKVLCFDKSHQIGLKLLRLLPLKLCLSKYLNWWDANLSDCFVLEVLCKGCIIKATDTTPFQTIVTQIKQIKIESSGLFMSIISDLYMGWWKEIDMRRRWSADFIYDWTNDDISNWRADDWTTDYDFERSVFQNYVNLDEHFILMTAVHSNAQNNL